MDSSRTFELGGRDLPIDKSISKHWTGEKFNIKDVCSISQCIMIQVQNALQKDVAKLERKTEGWNQRDLEGLWESQD